MTRNADWLRERSASRFFDRITMVTPRLDEVMENLKKLFELTDWTVQTERGDEYTQRTAVAWMGNVELCLTQPESGSSACSRHLLKYGEGLCCVRENLSAEAWEKELSRYEALGVPVIQRDRDDTGDTVWLDTAERIGGMLALHLDSPAAAAERKTPRNDRTLTQINVVTPDVDKTVAALTELLEEGPWSIGTLNNQTVTDPCLLVDGKLAAPEFHFQLGITFYSNIEFEVIQPVKGPTVYQQYLDSHGLGFHHIKEVVPVDKWDDTMAAYEKKAMPMSIKGQVSATKFAYLACEESFGFVVELGIPVPADPLPEGYNEYIYP